MKGSGEFVFTKYGLGLLNKRLQNEELINYLNDCHCDIDIVDNDICITIKDSTNDKVVAEMPKIELRPGDTFHLRNFEGRLRLS